MSERRTTKESVGTCGKAFAETIETRKNHIGSDRNEYPWKILSKTEYCDLRDSQYSLEIMSIKRTPKLPCKGDPTSELCLNRE